MSKIAVIIGSVREGRVSDRLATWVANEVKQHAEVEIVDLKDYPLPFMDEQISPRYNPERKALPAVQKWLDKVAEFDGYVMVTPEYNRSTSGVLKNAIDFLDFQIEQKPVALVGHGSAGGAQAVGNLRSALPGVGAVTTPQAVYITARVGDVINEAGELIEEMKANPYGPQAALESQIKQLVWFTDALKSARS